MRTTGALLLLFALPALAEEDERAAEIAKARTRVRALEEEIEALVARVSPSVGAVVNHATLFDVKTGRVMMRGQSLGSGVVVSRDGYFLTNYHVIRGAGYLTVTLPDGRTYPADRHADTGEGPVKGDIALLKLRGRDKFEYVDWKTGSTKGLSPGSFVFALGNPHGHALDGTPVVTMGIVSDKNRAAADRGFRYIGVIQTDAEINPGNSGGPLFDARGELVGINGLMKSRAGRSHSGVGFAIPMDQVRGFMKRLMRSDGEAIAYGFHGFEVQTAPGEAGAVITRVYPRSPAEEAGLRRGDVITKINGKRIANKEDYQNRGEVLPEGAVVRMAYLRRRKRETATYRLISHAEYRELTGAASNERKPLGFHVRGYLGAHWKEERGAIVITRVLENTGAERAGLTRDDLVVAVAGQTVGTAVELAKLLEVYRPKEIVGVIVRRGDKTKSLEVELCDARQAAEISSG